MQETDNIFLSFLLLEMQDGKQTIQQEALGALASLAQSAKVLNGAFIPDPVLFLLNIMNH